MRPRINSAASLAALVKRRTGLGLGNGSGNELSATSAILAMAATDGSAYHGGRSQEDLPCGRPRQLSWRSVPFAPAARFGGRGATPFSSPFSTFANPARGTDGD